MAGSGRWWDNTAFPTDRMPTAAIQTTLFGGCALVVLVSAIWVAILPNLFRAALSLGVVLLGVAGCFLLLEAEFLAFTQILVYVGAVLVLIVFAIMLTANLNRLPPTPATRHPVPAALGSLALFALLVSRIWAVDWPEAAPSPAVPTAALGAELVTRLLLPFEVVSLVLVAAIVGAVALAGTKRPRAPAG